MKFTVVKIALVLVLAGVGMTKASEQFTVVEITDVQRKPTRDIKTAADLATLKKSLDAEAVVFPKALELARKEWEATAASAGGSGAPHPTPFPGGLVPRKLVEKGNFPDQAKAKKYIEQLDASDATAQANEAKKKAAAKPTDADKARQAHENDHAAALARAAAAVQAKIIELLKASGIDVSAAPTAPAPAEKK